MITIYHNPKCGKSRNALKFLEESGQQIEVVEYLKNTPAKEELKSVIQKLRIKAHDLIRVKEDIYKEKYKGKILSDDEWIDVLVENPILIERPIVINKNKAVIAREEGKIETII
jgi:arsenate reductase